MTQISIMTPTQDYRLVVRNIASKIPEKRIILQRGYLRNNGSTCEHMWVDLPTIIEDEETEG